MAKAWAKQFYNSKEWKGVRNSILMRDKYICQVCKQAPAEEVHHIKHLTPANIYDKNIAVGAKNLLSVCRNCHFKIHEQDIKRSVAASNKKRGQGDIIEGYEFDEDGQVVPVTRNG